MDCIHLKNLTIRCLMGMSHQERLREQAIQLSLSLYFDASVAAKSGRLEHAVDYVRTLGEMRFLLGHGEFILIESAAEAIARYLLLPPLPDSPRADLSAANVVLTKPNALDGLAIPSLEIYRDKTHSTSASHRLDFGFLTSLHDTRDCGIHLIQLDPGKSVAVETAGEGGESEMVLGSHLFLQEKPVSPGSVFRWSKGQPRVYRNDGTHAQSILNISHPAAAPWTHTLAANGKTEGPFNPAPFYPGVLADYLKLPD